MGIINIFVFSSGGIAIVQSTYENQKTLFSLSKTDLNRQVFRDGKFVSMSEKNMVPGDIFKVEQGPMSVDAVLLQGNVVMDESSLTGESMPVAKGPLPSHEGVAYSQSTHKSSSCFAGTEVKPGSLSKGANDSPLGLVLATGASTTKGEQVRSILFGSKPQFKFDVHVQVVVLMLAITAVICFSIVIGFLKEDVISSWFYGMYVIATVLPPLLPTVFVVAVGFASDRLKKTGTKGVVCSDPNRILMAGKVRVCAFDKTGTLTKQGESAMEFHGITYVVNGDGTIKFNPRTSTISESVLVTHAMASAHSLSEITVNGKPEFIGNAVDLQMFQTVNIPH
jgi:magnesium-transporting ATPase (P-type)